MSKKTGPTKVRLSDFKERKEAEGAIDVETDDGQVFRIPPPELWPDEVGALASNNQMVELGQALLGDDTYKQFVAAGGSATILSAIFAEVHGLNVGE